MQGVARFAQTLNERDANLRKLLENAAKATGVLAKRTDEVVSLVKDTNALLAELRTQSAALDQIWYSVSAAAQQLKGFIEENRQELRPALDKLNGVLTIIDNRKERLQLAIKGLGTYAMSLGESVSSGPFFKAYIVNLLPGQFVQPFIDAAFSDLGLGPGHVAALAADRPADRPARDPGVAGALPADRSGRRAASAPARRDHRQPRRSGVRSARSAAARPNWLLSVPRTAAGPAARRPAARAPRRLAARAAVHTGADTRAGLRTRTG